MNEWGETALISSPWDGTNYCSSSLMMVRLLSVYPETMEALGIKELELIQVKHVVHNKTGNY